MKGVIKKKEKIDLAEFTKRLEFTIELEKKLERELTNLEKLQEANQPANYFQVASSFILAPPIEKIKYFIPSANPDNTPKIAESLNKIGEIYQSLSQPKKALEYFENALQIYPKIYQGDHPVIARCMQNIGIIYDKLDQTEKSLEYLALAFEMYRKLAKANHPNVPVSLTEIADLLQIVGIEYFDKLKNAEKALKYSIQALEIRKELYKDIHPAIAQSLSYIGAMYDKLEQIEQSLEYLALSCEMYRELAGANHPNVPVSLTEIADYFHSLGVNYFEKLGNIEKALKYSTQALEIRKELYKDIHPAIAQSLFYVGIIYDKLGQTEKSLESLDIYLEMCQKLYRTNPDSITVSLEEIANYFHSLGGDYLKKLGNAEKALKAHLQALKIRQELYKDNHLTIAQSLSNIGTAYDKLGQTEKSLEYKALSLEMHYRLPRAVSPDGTIFLNYLAMNFHNIGVNYFNKLDNAEKALGYQEQALKIKQELYKDDHPDIALFMKNIALSYNKLKNVEKYLEYMELSLEMYQKLCKAKNPDVNNSLTEIADDLHNLGVHYLNKLGNAEKALKYFEQALDIAREGNGPNITLYLYNIGVAYNNLGDKFKAIELFKQSYLIKCKLLGTNDPDTIKTKDKIISLDPKFSDINETRINILDRGQFNKNILIVQKHLQEKVLNKISALASYNQWSSGLLANSWTFLAEKADYGVKGYLSEKYLQKMLGKLANPENIKIAQMLCFEAMCLGVMINKYKNLTCIEEFAKAYPELLGQIIAEHPEYMVDGSIVKICVTDPTILTRLLGENFSGQGNADYIETDPLMEYTKEGMDKLLKLRLEAASQREVKTIMPNYVYDGSEESKKQLANEISNNLSKKSLVVINLFGKHWVGFVIEKGEETIDIHYMDSEQKTPPKAFKEELIKKISVNCPQHNIQFTESVLELQQYNNCGPELIENLVFYVLGSERTTSQEDVGVIHSALWEDSLMPNSTNSTSIPLLLGWHD